MTKKRENEKDLEHDMEKLKSDMTTELIEAHDIAVSWHLEHDPLTGLYNRMTFYEKTKNMMFQDPDKSYVMIYFDIEKFKVINDLFGSDVGDRILVEMANKLDSVFWERGTYGRLEADHFAVCFSTDTYEVEWVLNQLDESNIAREMNCNLSIYFGIYKADDIHLAVNQMCDRAMMALRTVKGNYWRRYALYDDGMRQNMLEEQKILSEVDSALKNHEFCVYLQPIYAVMEEQPVSAEALVRWQHPEKGLIPPDSFIPLFERNGFITELDEFVWEEVCSILAEAKKSHKAIVPISVNVSRINFYNPNLCEKLIQMIRKYDLEPSLLKLEVTESAYMDNPRQLMDAIIYLQRQGFSILMDDFGSGYSSLNMLKDMPIDILKIDMKFLDEVSVSGRAANVLTSVVRMAKWLEMEVVAEGVETKAQFDMLRSIGCDCVQGYYFSKPVPVAQFQLLLTSQGIAHKKEELAASQFDFSALWESNSQLNRLFDGLIGGMGLYEFNDSCLEVVRVNDGYYKMMKCSPQTLFQDTGNAFARLYEEDKQPLLDRCSEAKNTQEVQQIVVRKHREAATDEALMWLDIKIRYVGNIGKRELLYLAINDITTQKELENSQYLSRYSTALRVAFDEIVELDYVSRICRVVAEGPAANRVEIPLDQAVFQYGKRIHPADAQLFSNMHEIENLEELFECQGKTSVTFEVRKWVRNQGYCWLSFLFIKMDSVIGKKLILSCSRNVQEEKNAARVAEQNRILEIKQKEQQRYRIVAEQTGTVVLEMDFLSEEFYADPGYDQFAASRYSGEELLERLPRNVVYPDDEELYLGFLRKIYARVPKMSVEVRMKTMSGEYLWCRLTCSTVSTGEERPHRFISTINIIDVQKKVEVDLYRTTSELKKLLEETERSTSCNGCIR